MSPAYSSASSFRERAFVLEPLGRDCAGLARSGNADRLIEELLRRLRARAEQSASDATIGTRCKWSRA